MPRNQIEVVRIKGVATRDYCISRRYNPYLTFDQIVLAVSEWDLFILSFAILITESLTALEGKLFFNAAELFHEPFSKLNRYYSFKEWCNNKKTAWTFLSFIACRSSFSR